MVLTNYVWNFLNVENWNFNKLCSLSNMGPKRSENVKTLPLLQIAALSFQTCPEFSSQWS